MSKLYLNEIKNAIVMSEQANLFKLSNNEEKIEDACVKYLKFKGYKIATPKVFKVKIKDTNALIEYFYNLLNKDLKEYTTSCNEIKDKSIAKRFVESRMEATGASKEYALNECGEIITTIFEHKEEFNFKYALSFSIFGQVNTKWITDKAIRIMNEKLRKKEEVRAEDLRNKVIELCQSEDDFGFNDLDDLLAKIEEK